MNGAVRTGWVFCAVWCACGLAQAADDIPVGLDASAEGVSITNYVTPASLRLPYISHYRVEPRVTTAGNVVIRYYVTDWDHRKVRFGDDSERFDVTVCWSRADDRITWQTREQKGVPSGDGVFDLGKLAAGEYLVSLKCRDKRGLESRTLWMDFEVVTPESLTLKPSEIAQPTAAEFAAAGIVAERPGRYALVPVEIGDLPVPNCYGDVIHHKNKRNLEWSRAQYAELARLVTNAVESAEGRKAVVDRPDGYVAFIPARKGEYVYQGFRHLCLVPGVRYDAAAEETVAATNSRALTAYLAALAKRGVRKVVLPKGVYRISCAEIVDLPGGLTVDLNGSTLKLNGFAGEKAVPVRMLDVADSVLCNGVFEGNLYEFDYAHCKARNPEHVGALEILGDTRRFGVENVEFRYLVSHAFSMGISPPPWYYPDAHIQKFVETTVTNNRKRVDRVWTPDGEGRFKSPFVALGGAASNRYISVAKLMGYQGMLTKSWYFGITFFDAAKKPIRSETGYQYHRIALPKGAAYFRVSVEETDALQAEKCGLRAYMLRTPSHGVIRNCTLNRCRTCGSSNPLGWNFLFENLEFHHCGDESCRCAYDAEDGWDGQQNHTFRNIRTHDNPNGNFTICCSHDFVFEDCDFSIWTWTRAQSTLFRNCIFRKANLTCKSRMRSMYTRIENCRFTEGLELGVGKNDRKNPNQKFDWEIVLADTELRGTPEKPFALTVGLAGRLRDCKTENVKTHFEIQREQMRARAALEAEAKKGKK